MQGLLQAGAAAAAAEGIGLDGDDANEPSLTYSYAQAARRALGGAGRKRRQSLKPGQDKCWVAGCECTVGLESIPASRVEDAAYIMEHEMGLSFTKDGNPRPLPQKQNKLCGTHRPELPAERIIGAKVLLEGDEFFVDATVTGPAPPPAVQPRRPPGSARRRWWRATADSDDFTRDLDGDEEVWRLSRLRRLVANTVERSERVNKLRTEVKRLQRQTRELKAAAEEEGEGEGEGAGPDSSAPAGPPPAPTVSSKTVRLRVPVPKDWQPPQQPIIFEVPAGQVPHSMATTLMVIPPPSTVPGGFMHADVKLTIEEPPPVEMPDKGGKSSKHLREYLVSRASQAGLEYSADANPLNPARAWPLREQLCFANLRPEYFALPERSRLFKKMFGFDSWDEAMKVYEMVYRWVERTDGVRRAREERQAALHPRFQFLAALWRMRGYKDIDELASFFGLLAPRMSVDSSRWIRRLGRFAKENLIIEPKDYQTVLDLLPKSFKECGLDTVVAIGDCTDIMTETSRESIMTSNLLRSDKSKHSAAMGLTWCTPNGQIIIATDLFMGRSSEHEACKACIPAFERMPAKFSVMYDKGVSKLRVHLPHLNEVIIPCFLRKAPRFTIDQGIRNRGVTCCRYVVEVPFSGMKAWKMLGDVVKEEDKPLLNYVWWWTIGFHNLNCAVLKPPSGV